MQSLNKFIRIGLLENETYKTCTYSTSVDPIVIHGEIWSTAIKSWVAGITKKRIEIDTSGTTNLPKKIIHNLDLDFAQHIPQDLYWLCAYSPESYGAFHTFLKSQSLGAYFITIKIDESQKIKFPKCSIPTFFSLTTSQLKILQNSMSGETSSIVKVYLGGELVTSMDFLRAQKLFPNAKIYQIYATTELGVVMISETADFDLNPLGPFEIQIDESGELILNKNGTLLHSGDLFKKNSNGRWQFFGRANKSFKVLGKIVSAEYIESIIETAPIVEAAQVQPIPSPLVGNIIKAHVVLSQNMAPEMAEKFLLDFLGKKLLPHELPQIFNFIKQIKISKNGKKEFL